MVQLSNGAEYAMPRIVRQFLRHDHAHIDPQLPKLLQALADVGCGECWHKHSTFHEHLFQVYKILRVWNQSEEVCKCGLVHSAYSNSYVNLAVFKPDTERGKVQDLVGVDTEELIHLFCIVPRQQLIYNELLLKMDDAAPAVPESITVPHIHTGEPITVDRATIAEFLVMTMADFSDQLFSWQDEMFENTDGRLEFRGCNPHTLWPGEGKPGLWMTAVSRMGVLLRACVESAGAVAANADGSVHKRALPQLPPVFDNCSKILHERDQILARDRYWEVCCSKRHQSQHDQALALLTEAVEHNPYIAEPHVLMAQIYMHRSDWSKGLAHATRALDLLCQWGTAWDKRMNWEAWVAYTRVIIQGARDKKWATEPFGMLNMGLVSGLDDPL